MKQEATEVPHPRHGLNPRPSGRGARQTLDKSRTLPPLNFTPAEAVAIAITLARAGGSPYSRSARTALHKIVAAMSADDGASARDLAARIRFLAPVEGDDRASVPAVLEQAVISRRVVRLTYVDRTGTETERDVEPVTFTASGHGWYLTAWCRMRGERRIFRTDRVRRAALLEETAPDRSADAMHEDIPDDYVARPLELV